MHLSDSRIASPSFLLLVSHPSSLGNQPPPPPFPRKRHNQHSPVAASMRPNIWGAVRALGFMRQMTCLVPSSLSAAARQSMMADLPAPVGPTTMMPCRTR